MNDVKKELNYGDNLISKKKKTYGDNYIKYESA